MKQYLGKTALVTGAAGGIGRCTALAFAAAGARVVVSDIEKAAAQETVDMIVAAGGTATFIQADVTQELQVRTLIEAATVSYGRIDCAFNNAGIEEEHLGLAECDEATFDRIMNINVKGAWLCMKYEIQHMLTHGGGAIVNTSSVAGLVGAPLQSAYAASKHAVVGLTKTAAAEYGKSGIRINSVCPGVIRTAMMERAIEREPKRLKLIQSLHPIGRVGEANEVAEAVLWLCSDHASFVTGHQLAVDGGLTAI